VRGYGVLACVAAVASAAIASAARADSPLPPWADLDDLPIPAWARSVAPRKLDVAIYAAPGKTDVRRGSVFPGARLPLYGAKRGAGCGGRWLEVGPLAWICSDVAEMSPEDKLLPTIAREGDGMPFRYYFAGKDGAAAFLSLEHALDDAPDYELDPGFGIAVTEERVAHGERWGQTRNGRWIALRELGAAHPSGFHGEELAGQLDVGWIVADRASVYSASKADKAVDTRLHFQAVRVKEELATPGGAMVRISDDGAPPLWMRAKDVVRPTAAPPPPEVGGEGTHEKWIDVDLATQTVIAYDGARPVFATLASTGIGARGSETATPPGTHRIWVKLFTTNMDNLEKDDADRHYSIEDVPWVMFFDKGVALHAAFWHREFGHVKSHGCVNLAPLDARRLFDFTAPHLPAGWSAAFPTPLEPGTAVRVRSGPGVRD
jgi:lipoprotein-anchoring transpeptidase ErfK/SrfK